jgi:hypothetical protein
MGHVTLIPIHTAAAGLALFLLVFPVRLHPQSSQGIEVGMFSIEKPGDHLPAGWKPLTFEKIEKHTLYRLVKDNDTIVLKAVSQASASGLIREMIVDLKEYPILQWRWKVENILKRGDVHRKEGDDYPARIYVVFEYDPRKLSLFERVQYQAAKLLYGQYPPQGGINYLWESRAPVGTIVPNPFTGRVKMIVVESGGEKLNRWISEERDVYEDYKRIFGGEPPLISGVAIMTDTDNTEESATAYYGDIRFVKERGKLQE